jgi:hypothetical protein
VEIGTGLAFEDIWQNFKELVVAAERVFEPDWQGSRYRFSRRRPAADLSLNTIFVPQTPEIALKTLLPHPGCVLLPQDV